MFLILTILIFFAVLIAGFLLETLSLYSITKINSLAGVSFKKSAKIQILFNLATFFPGFLIGLAIGFLKLDKLIFFQPLLNLLGIAGVIYSLYVFHLIMNHYYRTRIWKNLGVLLLYTVVAGIICAFTIMPFWNWFKLIIAGR